LDHFLDFGDELQGALDAHEAVKDDFIDFFAAFEEHLNDLLVVSS
jgi:hypothetical protein